MSAYLETKLTRPLPTKDGGVLRTKHPWVNSSSTLSIRYSIVGAVLDKVVGPDVIAVLGPQPDA